MVRGMSALYVRALDPQYASHGKSLSLGRYVGAKQQPIGPLPPCLVLVRPYKAQYRREFESVAPWARLLTFK